MKIVTANKNIKVVERLAGTVNILNPKKKKKKKRHSRGMRDMDTTQTAMGKSMRRVLKGQLNGVTTFLDLSKKSSRKKKDGASRDAVKNLSKSTRKSTKQMSKAQPDFMDKMLKLRSVKRAGNQQRRMFRSMSDGNRFFN